MHMQSVQIFQDILPPSSKLKKLTRAVVCPAWGGANTGLRFDEPEGAKSFRQNIFSSLKPSRHWPTLSLILLFWRSRVPCGWWSGHKCSGLREGGGFLIPSRRNQSHSFAPTGHVWPRADRTCLDGADVFSVSISPIESHHYIHWEARAKLGGGRVKVPFPLGMVQTFPQATCSFSLFYYPNFYWWISFSSSENRFGF